MGGFGDFFKGAGGGLISGAFDLVGSGISAITGNKAQQREYERQKEFAQNGLRWRVEDAKAAGIHPIFAVGANTPSYSPQAAVGTDFGLSQVGQDIGRAIEAGQTRRERQEMADVQKAYYEAQVQNVLAQTEQHRAQTEAIKQGIINDALYNNVDFISQSALASQDKVRSQGGVPSKPETSGSSGGVSSLADPDPTSAFEINPDGKRVRLGHSQALHDKYEDMFIIEYLPVVQGMLYDLRYRLTREPVQDTNGKWYAWNGSFFDEVNIKTYRPWWHNWFRSNASKIGSLIKTNDHTPKRRPADFIGY